MGVILFALSLLVIVAVIFAVGDFRRSGVTVRQS